MTKYLFGIKKVYNVIVSLYARQKNYTNVPWHSTPSQGGKGSASGMMKTSVVNTMFLSFTPGQRACKKYLVFCNWSFSIEYWLLVKVFSKLRCWCTGKEGINLNLFLKHVNGKIPPKRKLCTGLLQGSWRKFCRTHHPKMYRKLSTIRKMIKIDSSKM